jgi:transposase
MIDVKEVLRRWQAGHSARRIHRETGVDRKTVARYMKWAAKLELPKEGELDDDDVHAVAECVQARPMGSPSDEWRALSEHRVRIDAWLKAKEPLRLSKVHVLLGRLGLAASYWTLRRFAIQELGWKKKEPTVRLDDPPPGQEAQVDFGEVGRILDVETGKLRRLWVLIVTLSFSRYMFVWPTFRQTLDAICEGLDGAWQFFDGMAHTIVPDNMKAIVAKADPLAPKLTEAFADYAQHRGLFADPARVRSPKDKARVENQVPYVRESWFAGESFADIDEARRSAEHWSRNVAGRRVHGTTRKVPLEVYEAHEKAAMKPAPKEPFDVPLWVIATVQGDCHVQVARALYSVPIKDVWLQRRERISVRVRADRSLVKIYRGTELIKVHARQPPGGRATDANDYPEGKAEYAKRDVDGLIERAASRGDHVREYAERVLDGPLPWARMRQVHALLRLCDKHGDGRVEAICQSALAFDVVDVHRIKRMLELAMTPPREHPGGSVRRLPLSTPRFARDTEHFKTRSTTEGTK